MLNAEEEDDLDSNSDVASLVLQEVQQYLCLAWKLLTISGGIDHAKQYLGHSI